MIESKGIVIATIDFSDCIDESISTNLGTLGRCEIKIYGNEGQIPHFHIKSRTTDKEICVCIFEPKYFNHNPKHTTLSRKEKNTLNEVLSDTYQYDKSKNLWKAIRDEWIQANNDHDYEHKKDAMKVDKPDYSKMTEDRHK